MGVGWFLCNPSLTQLSSLSHSTAWTSTKPLNTVSGLGITNAFAGGQGTYYWSDHWSSYVWVGGDGYPNANFYVATAPDPTGPWTAPKVINDDSRSWLRNCIDSKAPIYSSSTLALSARHLYLHIPLWLTPISQLARALIFTS